MQLSSLLRPNAVRAGVIPYTILNGEKHYLMGLSQYDDGSLVWSDFGGRCEEETAYFCLLRETDEESSGLLTAEVYEAMRSGRVSIHSSTPGDYLVLAEISYRDYPSVFQPNEEILNLAWLSGTELLRLPLERLHQPIRKYVYLWNGQ